MTLRYGNLTSDAPRSAYSISFFLGASYNQNTFPRSFSFAQDGARARLLWAVCAVSTGSNGRVFII